MALTWVTILLLEHFRDQKMRFYSGSFVETRRRAADKQVPQFDTVPTEGFREFPQFLYKFC
jgi:hypothetical protein